MKMYQVEVFEDEDGDIRIIQRNFDGSDNDIILITKEQSSCFCKWIMQIAKSNIGA